MNAISAILSVADSFALNTGINPYQPNYVLSTYRHEWTKKYLQKQWYRTDPVALRARESLISRRAIVLTQSDIECEIYEEARSYGSDANIVFANYFGGNIMIVGAKIDNPTAPSALGEFAEATRLAHRLSIIDKLSGLTDRQIEVLELADDGLLVAQIAAEMGVTEPAVNRLKKRICEALDVTQWNTAVNAYSLEKWGGLVAK